MQRNMLGGPGKGWMLLPISDKSYLHPSSFPVPLLPTHCPPVIHQPELLKLKVDAQGGMRQFPGAEAQTGLQRTLVQLQGTSRSQAGLAKGYTSHTFTHTYLHTNPFPMACHCVTHMQ